MLTLRNSSPINALTTNSQLLTLLSKTVWLKEEIELSLKLLDWCSTLQIFHFIFGLKPCPLHASLRIEASSIDTSTWNCLRTIIFLYHKVKRFDLGRYLSVGKKNLFLTTINAIVNVHGNFGDRSFKNSCFTCALKISASIIINICDRSIRVTSWSLI